MGITHSQITDDKTQADGRRHIIEEHTDHLGDIHTFSYLAEAVTDATAVMNARVTEIESQLDAQEVDNAMERVELGENPLTMTFEFTTQKKAARKMIRFAMKKRDPQLFLLLENLMDYLIANYTNEQLSNYLDMDLATLGRVKIRYNAIKAEKTFLTDDNSRIEEIENG